MVPQLQWVGWFFPVTDREEQYSKVSPRINPFEVLFAGFIDFIVAPTLAVCGDVISLVVGETADQDQVYKPFLALDLSSISDIDCILLISKMCSECAQSVLRVCFELHWSCSSEVL